MRSLLALFINIALMAGPLMAENTAQIYGTGKSYINR